MTLHTTFLKEGDLLSLLTLFASFTISPQKTSMTFYHQYFMETPLIKVTTNFTATTKLYLMFSIRGTRALLYSPRCPMTLVCISFCYLPNTFWRDKHSWRNKRLLQETDYWIYYRNATINYGIEGNTILFTESVMSPYDAYSWPVLYKLAAKIKWLTLHIMQDLTAFYGLYYSHFTILLLH